MPDEKFVENATEHELREFAGKLFQQVKVVRKAEVKFDAANTAEKEAKETVKVLANEKNQMIEDMDEVPSIDAMQEIKEKRLEEMRAELDASEKNSLKNEAKHALASAEKSLIEMIDEANDKQKRIDFDKANRSEVAVELPESKDPATSPNQSEERKDWREVSIDEMDMPAGMKKPLKEIGVLTIGDVQSLVFGKLDGYSSASDIQGWGTGRVQKFMHSVAAIVDDLGIVDFDLSDSATLDSDPTEPEAVSEIPTTLEDQFPLAIADTGEEYDDVEDEEVQDVSLAEIRITNIPDDNDMGLSLGDIVSGVKEGGKVTIENSNGSIVLLPHEYELTEPSIA